MNPVDREQAKVLRDYLDDERVRDPELRHILALADRAMGQEPQSYLLHPEVRSGHFEGTDYDEEDLAA